VADVIAEARARAVLASARARGWRIATAESCTGGLVGAALTDVPGSSDVFDRGYLVYSYPAKTAMLDVPEAMLAEHGAVSEPVARAMAEGALAKSGVEIAVAITGVAGPGGSDAKPEGLVWFAVASPAGVIAERRAFGPLGRAVVRQRSVETALDLVLQVLDAPDP
jgi:nicotinamide-nucleotide amidase